MISKYVLGNLASALPEPAHCFGALDRAEIVSGGVRSRLERAKIAAGGPLERAKIDPGVDYGASEGSILMLLLCFFARVGRLVRTRADL